MGKKKKLSQKQITDYLFDDYINNRELTSSDSVLKELEILVDNGLGCKLTANEDVSVPYQIRYKVASKFMIKHNKSLKKYTRELLNSEPGGKYTLAEDNTADLAKLGKYSLDAGIYYASLSNGKHNNYAVMKVTYPEQNDLYIIAYDLYIIGDKFIKYKDEVVSMYKEYKKKLDDRRNESIWYTDGRPCKDAIFKPFDKMVFRDKEKYIEYIDNWVSNIPNYHKYGMIPKLSILLYGDPGTGKSTFTKALAKYLDIERVLSVSPDYFTVDDQSGGRGRQSKYYNSPYVKTVISVDDIDCIANAREDDTSKENNQTMSTLLEFLDNPGTFYFRAKDGKDYLVSIIVATTNYYDKLDPAVKRYGRFDLKIEMSSFDEEQAREMCAIYDVKLEDVYKDEITKDFKISPSYLQALCLENIDKTFKETEVKSHGKHGKKGAERNEEKEKD